MIQNIILDVNSPRLPPITHFFVNGSFRRVAHHLPVIKGNIVFQLSREVSMRPRRELADSFADQKIVLYSQ
jgi:hypothetical protein